MTDIKFITSNSWSMSDLGINSEVEEIINHLISVYPKGINIYIGIESGKIYDLWLD